MFNQYPYLNIQDLNLDYILKAIREMRYEVTNFVSINAIKYADPIQWNITTQYEKNTIVIDPVTGTAYISVAPVPAGVALTRPEYWTVVFDLGMFVTKAAQNLTSHWENETTTTATFASNEGDWLVWGDVLYVALTNITAGDQYVVNSNIKHFTIEEIYNAYLDTVGDLANLITSDTSNLVNAINSVLTDLNTTIGDLGDLQTDDTSNIVNAINTLVGDRVLVHEVVADVIADNNLKLDDVVCTLGYYSVGDFGAALYKIVDSGRYEITLDNGLHGRLMHNGTVNIAQYGASQTDGAATLAAFNKIIAENIADIVVPKGDWKLTGTVEILKTLTIRGVDILSSRITQSDKTLNLFDVGDAGTNAVLTMCELSLWNNPATTDNPDKMTNATTTASNMAINVIKGVGSSFKRVKVNRTDIAINVASGNYTIDFIECRLHSNDNGIVLNGSNQAINVVMTDFDNDLHAIKVGSGIGAVVVDKCQIENCRVGIRKDTAGDVTIKNCYFDANGRRSIELDGALRKVIISDNIFLENSLTTAMIDGISMTAGEIILNNNVVNSINATEFYRANAIPKYEFGTMLINSALMTNNTTRLYKSVYDYQVAELSANGVSAGSAQSSPCTLKLAAHQYIANTTTSPTDFTIDLTDANALPLYAQIDVVTTLTDGNTITLSGATIAPASAATHTNSSGDIERLVIKLVKVGATGWSVRYLT